MTWAAAALPAALLIDRIVGDPPWLWARLPHPVVLVGGAIDALEHRLNRPDLPEARRRLTGVAALAVLVAAVGGIGALLAAPLIGIPYGFLLEAAVASVFLAQKSLTDHVAAVARALQAEGLGGGRRAVALIVGRDVSVLDEAGVARAAVESAAENFSDGVVAPAFWFLLLGLPGLLVYKAVNTADSMIGHRSPRFESFGWAAARFDDVLNWIPSRLAAGLIAAASVGDGRAGRAIRAALRDAPRHRSPNAGWPEAAAAGALGLALGGPRRYGETVVDGAWLHPEGRRDAGAPDIASALRLIKAAWWILFGLAVLIALWSAR